MNAGNIQSISNIRDTEKISKERKTVGQYQS
jgi:hypothetical protein